MKWLAQLTFPQALRWALLWPSVLAVVAVGAVTVAASQDNWGFSFGFTSRGRLPVRFAVTVVAFVVVLGPSALFLALWRAARR